MKALIIAIFCVVAITTDGSPEKWRNIYEGNPELAGVLVQQLPDNAAEAPRWRGKHPAMILFVFWGGRVRQFGYSPDGIVKEDFWWQITPDQSYIWQQLDYSKGSDPRFRHHADPRKNA